MSVAPLSADPDGVAAPVSAVAAAALAVSGSAVPGLAVPDPAAADLAVPAPAVPELAVTPPEVPDPAAAALAVPAPAVPDLAESAVGLPDRAAPIRVALPASNGVVDAFYLLQNAEALYQSRLRDRLHLGANELGAMQVISRLATLGLDARALDISRSLGVTSGATSVILGHLIARGYLTRTANPRDGRGKLLHLTDEATAIVSHSLDDSQSDLSQLVSGMSTRESKRVVVLLTAVTSSLDRSGHADQ